jgi:hypothetical protein
MKIMKKFKLQQLTAVLLTVIVIGKVGRTFKDAGRPADSIATAARGQEKVTVAWIAQQSRVEGRDHDGRKILIDVVTNILRRDGTVSGQDQHHFRSGRLLGCWIRIEK